MGKEMTSVLLLLLSLLLLQGRRYETWLIMNCL